MSGFVVAAASAIADVVLRPKRRIVGKPTDERGQPLADQAIVADAVVSEMHDDTLVITDHPVERGAEISDHAYRKPATVTLQYGWAAASKNAIRTASNPMATGVFDRDFLRGVYDAILKIQRETTLCEVYTGKRFYPAMLVQNVTLETNKDTERALIVRVVMREVILVQTFTTIVPVNGVMANAAATGGMSDMGGKALGPSVLLDATGGLAQ